jgi:endonuclease/exonuclease/phosphatase family metal-dependent hydrolase
MGDFNLPEIDYSGYTVKGEQDSYQMRFFDLTQDLFLMQNVFEVTRMRRGQEPSRLDYVFTIDENKVDNLE